MNKGCDIRHLSERSKVRPLGAFLLLLGVLAFAPSTVLAANSGHFSEGQLIAAVRQHQTRDGANVDAVVASAGPGIQIVGWWASRDDQEAGFAYLAYPAQDRHVVSWQISQDGTVTPDADEAWIVDLGRAPFAYFVNQRNADNGVRWVVNRRMLGNPAVLTFLPAADGNLADAFKQRHLILRSMKIEWVVDPKAVETDGALYLGYLVTVSFDCPGARPSQAPTGQHTMRFIEPKGTGDFQALKANDADQTCS
jgi:hypothetical protein